MEFKDFFHSVQTETLSALNLAGNTLPLQISASFDLGHKTVSEIGGRFIEEYITQALNRHFENSADFKFEYLSSRSLGDYKIESRRNSGFVLYVDIKAQHMTIRALGKGQIQLSRLNSLAFNDRDKSEFLELVQKIATRPRATRGTSHA